MGFLTGFKIKSLEKKVARLHKARQSNPASDADLQKEISLYYQLAELYKKNKFNKKIPNADLKFLENYRAAATLGDANALYLLSQQLFERGRFWQEMQHSIYSCKAHERYARDTFEEAFVYLASAEEKGHSLAKRLHGVALIQGWGVEANQEQGFQRVVDSIDQEGAWDRATQIFEELGLNKPEFFSTIMSMKQQRQS